MQLLPKTHLPHIYSCQLFTFFSYVENTKSLHLVYSRALLVFNSIFWGHFPLNKELGPWESWIERWNLICTPDSSYSSSVKSGEICQIPCNNARIVVLRRTMTCRSSRGLSFPQRPGCLTTEEYKTVTFYVWELWWRNSASHVSLERKNNPIRILGNEWMIQSKKRNAFQFSYGPLTLTVGIFGSEIAWVVVICTVTEKGRYRDGWIRFSCLILSSTLTRGQRS